MFPEGDGTVAPVLSTESATGDQAQQPQDQAQPQGQQQADGQPSPQQGDSPVPTPAPAPEPVSPEIQRVRDAQARMHAATTETARLKEVNADLRQQLDGVLQDPRLLPVAVDPVGDPDMAALYREYTEKPGDAESFAHIVNSATELATKRMQGELRAQQAQRINQARLRQRTEIVTNLIGERAATLAPDVTPKLFWAMTHIAEAETPVHLVNPVERLEWQMVRSIQLAREQIDPRVTAAATNATTHAATLRNANAVMPGSSGTGRAIGSGGRDTTPAPTMVDQIRATQDRRVAG